MKIPKILLKNKKKYYFVEKCKNFVRYQTDRGICECFGFHDLNMIEEQEKSDRKIYNDGMMIL